MARCSAPLIDSVSAWHESGSFAACRSQARLLNQLTAQRSSAWQQPQVVIDSVNFADIVKFQLVDDRGATGEIVALSVRRLESRRRSAGDMRQHYA